MVSSVSSIPFTVYDFFGCLAAGFILLAAGDLAFDLHRLARDEVPLAHALLWVIAAYIAGHIVANVAGYALEHKVVRGMLGSPEELLMRNDAKGKACRWTRVFPGYYRPLPSLTSARISEQALQRIGECPTGSTLFHHCHAIVRRDAITFQRLSTFLNLYGFCRNACMAACLGVITLIVGMVLDWWQGDTQNSEKLWFAVAGVAVAIGLFYRYLKFYRQYTQEVLLTYVELD